MGMVNVGDAIYVIDKLVLRDKKYTLEDISVAVKNNFEGYEQIRTDLLSCQKFGINGEADDYTVRIAHILAKNIRAYDHDNFYFMPSLHSLDGNVKYGAMWTASYDGRYAYAPYAKNAGSSVEVRKKDPTSVILLSAKIPQYKFYGGQPLDIHFDPALIKTKKQKIAAVIKTYLQNGGLQLQVNSLSSKVLENAIENPQNHKDLIVRIGGYSDYFNNFEQKVKKDFVQRFKREEIG